MSSITGNRLSTPEAGHVPVPRPAQSRNVSNLARASADVSSLSQTASRPLRPSSEMIGQHVDDILSNQDEIADQWIADINQYESTLEDMAEATLDQDFKDELSAIEQWFRVLTEAERTAALYALLNQTTQVQNRFFIGVLQQQGKNHPISSVLSPNSFEKGILAPCMISPKVPTDHYCCRPYGYPNERCYEQTGCRRSEELACP
jgi:RNA-binding protein VTS1